MRICFHYSPKFPIISKYAVIFQEDKVSVLKVGRGLLRFDFFCRVWKNSFFYRSKNSFASCWILVYFYGQYLSFVWNLLGDGNSTSVLIVNRWFSIQRNNYFWSFKLPTVRERQFTINSTSQVMMGSASSSRHVQFFCISTFSTLKNILI